MSGEDAHVAHRYVGPSHVRALRIHTHAPVIVKASSGPRYVVGCRRKIDAKKLTNGTRVALDMTTLTIMRTVRPPLPNICLLLHPSVPRAPSALPSFCAAALLRCPPPLATSSLCPSSASRFTPLALLIYSYLSV